MLPTTDVKGDGGIWLVEKSHKYGGSKRAWDYEDFDKSQLIEVTASAGSLIFFDMEMIHRAGTPLNNNNRIIRFMYGPNDGYFMPMLIPIVTFPSL